MVRSITSVVCRKCTYQGQTRIEYREKFKESVVSSVTP